VTAVASCGAAGGGGGLGKKDVAKGEPVKIGMVSDGKSANLDNSFQIPVSEGIVEYINTYRGGVGGQPIELLHCETGQANASKSNECANELIAEGAVMIVMPDATGVSAVHEVTAAAKIPLFLYSITDTAVTTDTDRTFVLYDPRAGVSALPISVAKDNKLKIVTPVVIDVPAATELYTSKSGQEPFKKAKLKLNVVPIPPGQADMTPQMTEIANGDPTEVQIIGNDTFCISAFKGLEAAGFDGPISTLYVCITDATKQGVGSYLKGTYVSVSAPIGDTKDPGYKQLKKIVDTYSSTDEVPDLAKAMNTYAVWMSMYQAIENMKGEINPDTITEAIKSMPNMKTPTGDLDYRCNGKAKPELPAVCTPGGLRTRLNAEGDPTLPYKVVGNGPVPA
jgi:branched-chain amino acid transport system substrate-binding protein